MDAKMQAVRRRRLFAGISMIAAPLLVGTATLMGTGSSDDTTAMVTALATDPDAVYVASLLYLGGLLLFVPVVLALAHLLREKAPWMSEIGALLGVAGLVLVAALSGVFATVTQVADLDVATGVRVMDGLESNPVVLFGFAGSIAFATGVIVLAVGLLRAHAAPRWIASLLALGAVLQLTGDLAAVDALGVVGIGALLLALAPLGYELLTEPDEAWIRPASSEGSRSTLET